MKRAPIIIAHRGASAYLPEHSLAAKAMAHAMGADFIEQDVVLSKDGVPMVLHDVHLECTTDVARCFPGRARADDRYYAIDFTLHELRQLRLHERSTRDASGQEVAVYPGRFPLQATPFAIPTLAEEIDLIAGLDHSRGCKTGLYVELKSPLWHMDEGLDIASAVLEVLADKGYADRCEQVFLQCFEPGTLRRLRHELKTPLPLIQLVAENDWGEDGGADYDQLRTAAGLTDIASYADGIGPWLMHIYQGVDATGKPVLSNLVELAHQRDLKVHPYTLRHDELPTGVESFDQLLDILVLQAGVDGFFTDFPDLARHFLEQHW